MNINPSHRVGMAVPLVLTIILVLAALGGAIYYSRNGDSAMEKKDGDSVMEKKDGDSMMEKSPAPTPDAMMEKKDGDSMMTAPFVPGGTVLAGTKSLLVDFSKADYDKAVSEGRVVLLYFYANWCPICRAEFPRAEGAFNALSDSRIVGFRVSYNDNETDQYEEALARQFGVAYQHTKVILKNGQQVLKNGETWDTSRYLTELGKATQ